MSLASGVRLFEYPIAGRYKGPNSLPIRSFKNKGISYPITHAACGPLLPPFKLEVENGTGDLVLHANSGLPQATYAETFPYTINLFGGSTADRSFKLMKTSSPFGIFSVSDPKFGMTVVLNENPAYPENNFVFNKDNVSIVLSANYNKERLIHNQIDIGYAMLYLGKAPDHSSAARLVLSDLGLEYYFSLVSGDVIRGISQRIINKYFTPLLSSIDGK